MPVIVVGADTDVGEDIVRRLADPVREIRVFVTDVDKGLEMREKGLKVAVGDVSDDSHVEAAATRCFSAVLIAEAAEDDRERSFAANPDEVLRGWARAVSNSSVPRVIWVISKEPPETQAPEVVSVDPGDPDVARRVFELDEAHSIS
jgi:nucleoside-diphosphate-sugar epimerase